MGAGGDVVPDVAMEGELVDDLAIPLVGRAVVLVQVRWCSADILDLAVVDERSAFSHGVLDAEHRAEWLVGHIDQGKGLLGRLPVDGDDGGHAVADMAHLAVHQPSVVWARLRLALSGLHVVDVWTVEVRDDALDAFEGLGPARVDRCDVGHGEGRAEDGEHVGALLHLVLDEDLLARYEGASIDLAGGLAYVLQAIAEAGSRLRPVFAIAPLLLDELDGQMKVLVACVADEDRGEGLVDIMAGGVGLPLQEPGQDQGDCGRVVGALDDAGGDHRLLDVVELRACPEAFCGADLMALGLVEESQVGRAQLAVHDDNIAAREALSVVAVANARASKAVEGIAQPHRHVETGLDPFSVQCEYCHASTSLARMSAHSRAM